MDTAPPLALRTDLDAWARADPGDLWRTVGWHWHLWAADVVLRPRDRDREPTEAPRHEPSGPPRTTPVHVAHDPAVAAAWLADAARAADARALPTWAGLSAWAQDFDWHAGAVLRGLAVGRSHASSVRMSDTLALDLYACAVTAHQCGLHGGPA